MNNWRKTTWGTLATLEYGKSLRDYENASGTYRVYGTNGPIGWHDKPLCVFPGVIIGRKGAYRGVHFSSQPFFVIDTAFYLNPITELDVKWAYYQLLTQDINGMDSGSAIPSTSRESFYNLPVKLPPLPEQKAIAAILSSFDGKIELLRRQNKTLESIAQTIFEEWFIKFKVNSKTVLPEGWRIGKLGDIIEISPTRNLKKGKLASYLDMKGVPTQGHRAEGWYLRQFSAGSKFAKGDTLFARITPCLENGKTAFVDFLEDKEIAWGSTEFIVLCPKIPFPPFYGYLLARSDAFRNFAIGQMTGSSGRQRVPEDTLANYDVVIPPDEVMGTFAELIEPFVRRLTLNGKESQNLSRLRDLLLPKLMRGEIRVGEVR